MIVTCKCGTKYNNKTVNNCPLCIRPAFIRQKKDELGKEIREFRREQIQEKKAVVNSFRNNERAIREQQKLR